MSGPHPGLDRLLASMPRFLLRRAALPEDGRYYDAHGVALIRHGLRGPAYFVAVGHEAVHAKRGDRPCVSPELEARQELIVERDTARLLIDIHHLADVAVAYRDDAHRIAEELDVDYDTLQTRMRWLHPSERHYLARRLAPEEESA